MSDPRLGRLFAPDARDARFHVRRRFAATPTVATSHYWFSNGWWGNQGNTPQCVSYSWTHWVEDGPIKHAGPAPTIDPGQLYAEAKTLDEWPGEDYDGTSVRAGAKALQARGLISSYEWAVTLTDVVNSLLTLGPMVVGTNWYEQMFSPDEAGFIRVGGDVAGGHAWLLDGVSVPSRHFRIKNSWGRSWGANGFALISFDDFERLLSEDGEAAIALEVGVELP